MALHLYYCVIKCHDTQADISEIPSMYGHLDNKIPGNVLNIQVNVSIDTKLFTCKILMYDMKHFSGMCYIARARRASVVR